MQLAALRSVLGAVRTRFLSLLCGLLVVGVASTAAAETPPLPVPNLKFGDNFGSVRAAAPLPDGGLLIGGAFDTVNGLPREGIVRVNADGTLNTAWNANLRGEVLAIQVVGDSVYLGGAIWEVAGQQRSNVVKVALADGALIASWTAGVSGTAYQLAEDGTDLFVGGEFQQASGQPRQSLARFALDTGALRAWTSNLGASSWIGRAEALLLDGGNLYVGGNFNSVGGVPRDNLARVPIAGNGAPDANWIANAQGYVDSLAVHGAHLYVGGSFSTLGGVARTSLGRVSTGATATVDITWTPDVWGAHALYADASGVLCACYAPSVHGLVEYNLTDGARTAWAPSLELVAVRTLVAAGSNLFVDKGLIETQSSNLVRLTRAGTVDSAFAVFAGEGSRSRVNALAHAPDGSTYVGGNFHGVDGHALVGLVRIGADGTLDPAWRPAPRTGYGTEIHALALSAAGTELYAGGLFAEMGGLPRSNLARIGTGAAATVDPLWDPSADNRVSLMALDATGLYVAGSFEMIGGAARDRFAKLQLTGSGALDAGWNMSWLGPFTETSALAAGGGFVYVARWSESTDQSDIVKLAASTGVPDPAFQVAATSAVRHLLLTGGMLYAGGHFSAIGQVAQRSVAKLDAVTGAVDAAWMPQFRRMPDALTEVNGALIVGADLVRGQHGGNIAAVSVATGHADVEWNPAFGAFSRTATAKNGNVWLGGSLYGEPAGVVAFSAPFCAGKPNGTPCGAGTGLTASCQASICTAVLATTTVSVTAAPNPVRTGSLIYLTVTVTSDEAVATGRVSFHGAGGEYLGETHVENGAAAYDVAANAAFSQITAVYSGSPLHKPARSNPVSVVVLEHTSRNDVSGDGRSDVIFYHTGIGGLVAMNANGLSLGAAYILDHEPDLNWKVAGIGDLNDDGHADVVWQNRATGAVYGLLLDGGAVAGEGQIYVEPNTAWKIVQLADVTDDGKADLIWRNEVTGEVYVQLMDGLTPYAGSVVYTEPNPSWKIVAGGDLNGDGYADLLWRNAATGDVYAMLMQSLGVLSGGVIYNEPNLDWKIIGLADFNGDGRADVLWQNTATGDVYQMQINGTTVSAGQVIYNEPNTSWKIAALGDYNGDGRADILWQNTSTGQVYMMLMNGFTVTSGAFVYTEADLQWRIVGP